MRACFAYSWILAVCFAALAQETTPSSPALTRCWWTNAGIGLAGKDDNPFGISIAASHSQQFGPQLFTLRFGLNEEIEVLGNNLQEHMFDVGILYGLCYRPTFFRIARRHGGEFALGASMSLSAGISAVGGNEEGKFLENRGMFESYYDDDVFLTAGVPLQAELFLVPHKNFGLGVIGAANFSRIASYWGVMACVQYGILRW